MRTPKHLLTIAAIALFAIAQTACDLVRISEDLSDCNPESSITYDLHLVTNLETELETILDADADVVVKDALRDYLSDIFTDYAHDVDLSFYDTKGDSLRRHYESHIMDANQSSYSLTLPVRQYMHVAAANIADNHLVDIDSTTLRCHDAALIQHEASVIGCHNTGLFTARLPMDILDGLDQTFNVHLYMANCATALVLDTVGVSVRDIDVKTTGFATAFDMADSVYTFPTISPMVQTEHIPLTTGTEALFCSVNFPSPETPRTRLVIETEAPFVSSDAGGALWSYQVDITKNDGTIIRSLLNVRQPLRAGQLRVIKAFIDDEGQVRLFWNMTSVSISTEWQVIYYPDVPLGGED